VILNAGSARRAPPAPARHAAVLEQILLGHETRHWGGDFAIHVISLTLSEFTAAPTASARAATTTVAAESPRPYALNGFEPTAGNKRRMPPITMR